MVKYAVTHAVWNHSNAPFPQRKGRSSCVTTAALLKATTSLVKTETIIKSYTSNEFSLLCHILPRIPRGKTCGVIHSFRQPVTGLKHTCSRQYRLYIWIGYLYVWIGYIWIALLTVNSRIQNLRPKISLFSGSLSIFLYKLSVKPDFCSSDIFLKTAFVWTSLPRWDGSPGGAHGNALGARSVEVVLSVDGESVMAVGGWKRRHHRGTGEVGIGQRRLHLVSFGLSTPHANVIVVGGGGHGCCRPKGRSCEGVALPHHRQGSCHTRAACRAVIELPLLRSQNSIRSSSGAVD